MEVIDALAGNNVLLDTYAKQLEVYKDISKTITELKGQRDSASKELDYNTFLYNELQEAGLIGIDQASLEETFETLNNSEAIQEALSNMIQLFSEERIGTMETSKEARSILGKLQGFSGKYEGLWSRLNSVVLELEDILEETETLTSSLEADPEKLFEVNEKLQLVYKMQQKHSVSTVNELLNIQNDLAEKIDNTATLDDRILALETKLFSEKSKLTSLAKELHEARKKAIPKLKKELELYLEKLGLPNAQFQFELKDSETFKKNGLDVLELMFTANKGLAFGPLKKIASGGEMSRIMLAVKAVLAQYKKLPTIIFDEIDTGVSGEIANRMAHIMSTMSKKMQLISITHLPQIAAKGEHHIKVYKEDVNEVTRTRIKSLNDDERVVEIAQMIGGKNVTDAAIANAKELLN
jgi:DNA repair protein RecN (Recombination protein N)